MSGISGSGRHVASHAKPGKIVNAKGKVKTAAAVTSVLAVSGGVATAFHLHQDALRNSTEAASQDSNSSVAAAAGALAARSSSPPAANRDLQRPDLNTASSATSGGTTPGAPSSTAPGTPTPTSDSSSSRPPVTPTPTSDSSSSTPKPPSSTSTTSKPTTPTTTKTSTPTKPATSSSSSSVGMGDNATPAQAQAIAKEIVPSGQYACFANIISHESSWNVHAVNPSSGAYGLAQALPASKYSEFGSDWRNSATIQIKWALAYMTSRYGSPCAAWTFWQNHNWY